MVDNRKNRECMNQVLKLIRLYRANQCLWNSSVSSYRNSLLKEKAWQRIARFFDNKLTVEQLKLQIVSLRYYFATELLAIKRSKIGGYHYVPQLACFKELKFLKGAMKPSINVRATESESHDLINCIVEDAFLLSSSESSIRNDCAGFKTPLSVTSEVNIDAAPKSMESSGKQKLRLAPSIRLKKLPFRFVSGQDRWKTPSKPSSFLAESEYYVQRCRKRNDSDGGSNESVGTDVEPLSGGFSKWIPTSNETVYGQSCPAIKKVLTGKYKLRPKSPEDNFQKCDNGGFADPSCRIDSGKNEGNSPASDDHFHNPYPDYTANSGVMRSHCPCTPSTPAYQNGNNGVGYQQPAPNDPNYDDVTKSEQYRLRTNTSRSNVNQVNNQYIQNNDGNRNCNRYSQQYPQQAIRNHPADPGQGYLPNGPSKKIRCDSSCPCQRPESNYYQDRYLQQYPESTEYPLLTSNNQPTNPGPGYPLTGFTSGPSSETYCPCRRPDRNNTQDGYLEPYQQSTEYAVQTSNDPHMYHGQGYPPAGVTSEPFSENNCPCQRPQRNYNQDRYSQQYPQQCNDQPPNQGQGYPPTAITSGPFSEGRCPCRSPDSGNNQDGYSQPYPQSMEYPLRTNNDQPIDPGQCCTRPCSDCDCPCRRQENRNIEDRNSQQYSQPMEYPLRRSNEQSADQGQAYPPTGVTSGPFSEGSCPCRRLGSSNNPDRYSQQYPRSMEYPIQTMSNDQPTDPGQSYPPTGIISGPVSENSYPCRRLENRNFQDRYSQQFPRSMESPLRTSIDHPTDPRQDNPPPPPGVTTNPYSDTKPFQKVAKTNFSIDPLRGDEDENGEYRKRDLPRKTPYPRNHSNFPHDEVSRDSNRGFDDSQSNKKTVCQGPCNLNRSNQPIKKRPECKGPCNTNRNRSQSIKPSEPRQAPEAAFRSKQASKTPSYIDRGNDAETKTPIDLDRKSENRRSRDSERINNDQNFNNKPEKEGSDSRRRRDKSSDPISTTGSYSTPVSKRAPNGHTSNNFTDGPNGETYAKNNDVKKGPMAQANNYSHQEMPSSKARSPSDAAKSSPTFKSKSPVGSPELGSEYETVNNEHLQNSKKTTGWKYFDKESPRNEEQTVRQQADFVLDPGTAHGQRGFGNNQNRNGPESTQNQPYASPNQCCHRDCPYAKSPRSSDKYGEYPRAYEPTYPNGQYNQANHPRAEDVTPYKDNYSGEHNRYAGNDLTGQKSMHGYANNRENFQDDEYYDCVQECIAGQTKRQNEWKPMDDYAPQCECNPAKPYVGERNCVQDRYNDQHLNYDNNMGQKNYGNVEVTPEDNYRDYFDPQEDYREEVKYYAKDKDSYKKLQDVADNDDKPEHYKRNETVPEGYKSKQSNRVNDSATRGSARFSQQDQGSTKDNLKSSYSPKEPRKTSVSKGEAMLDCQCPSDEDFPKQKSKHQSEKRSCGCEIAVETELDMTLNNRGGPAQDVICKSRQVNDGKCEMLGGKPQPPISPKPIAAIRKKTCGCKPPLQKNKTKPATQHEVRNETLKTRIGTMGPKCNTNGKRHLKLEDDFVVNKFQARSGPKPSFICEVPDGVFIDFNNLMRRRSNSEVCQVFTFEVPTKYAERTIGILKDHVMSDAKAQDEHVSAAKCVISSKRNRMASNPFLKIDFDTNNQDLIVLHPPVKGFRPSKNSFGMQDGMLEGCPALKASEKNAAQQQPKSK